MLGAIDLAYESEALTVRGDHHRGAAQGPQCGVGADRGSQPHRCRKWRGFGPGPPQCQSETEGHQRGDRPRGDGPSRTAGISLRGDRYPGCFWIIEILLESDSHVAHGLEAHAAVFAQAALEQIEDRLGHTRREVRPVGVVLEDGGQYVRDGLTLKPLLSGDRSATELLREIFALDQLEKQEALPFQLFEASAGADVGVRR